MLLSIAPSEAAIEAWLSEAVNLEKTGDYREVKLDRTRRFMAAVGGVPAPCTVTGTKGKGSTLRLIECALLAAGQSTVAFTSPHVASVCERWRIDGQPATPAQIAELCNQVAALQQQTGIALTYFERCFAIACLLAAARHGAVGARFLCEVGLGGRLDCANTLDAAVVVVTHLSRDHCAVLGPTVADIAPEKLALARRGRPLVIAPQNVDGARAIHDHLPTGVRARWVRRATTPFALALAGDHQQDNAATALAAVQLLDPRISEETARAGFATAQLAARCQLVEQRGRRILVDGAHNGHSIAATLAVAAQLLRPGWRCLLGLAKDKEIADILATIPDGLVVERVGYDSHRSRQAIHWPEPALSWPWHERITAAIAAQPADHDLCITGSLYLAGEALAQLGVARQLPG